MCLYSQIIITEMALAHDQKTVRPVDIGGVAGGSKYIVDGILFKVACDVQIQANPPLFMYGGKVRRDDLAIKAAGNELKGVCAAMGLMSGASPPIHTPFMIMVCQLNQDLFLFVLCSVPLSLSLYLLEPVMLMSFWSLLTLKG